MASNYRSLMYLFALLLLFPFTSAHHHHGRGVGALQGISSSSASHQTPVSSTPLHHSSNFSFTPTQTACIATSNPPLPLTTFAKPYSAVSNTFANVSSTTWSNWSPIPAFPTDLTDPYGQAAYSALWNAANPISFSRGLYSTTVSPTPVPTSELIYPPPLVFGPTDCYTFPSDFVFGIAGSASQCEGAVADQGKSPTITDMIGNFMQVVELGTNHVYNYVANEHYYLYQQDIERFAAIGAKYYSFTLSWARIMPFALPGTPVNIEAIQHYNDVIDFILSKGMQPVVTLTHFDTPLQFFGGGSEWFAKIIGTRSYYGMSGMDLGYDNATVENAFVNYAEIAMSHFASKVPIWITFNEPQLGSKNGVAVNTVVKAHARVVHFYREVLNGTGKVSMKMGLTPAIPLNPADPTHVSAAETYTDLYVNPYLNPLAVGQDYPDAFKWAVQDYVPLTAQDLEFMNGTLDFIALDAYSAPVVYPIVSDFQTCAQNNATSNSNYRFPICLNTTTLTTTGWDQGYDPSGSATDYTAPSGLRTQLNYVWDKFQLPILISEFGLTMPYPTGNQLADNLYNVPQSEYLLSYLGEMLKAIWEDGVDVMGAFVWNWGDDWEFISYDTGYGLQYVNRTTQERFYRRSFFDVISFFESRQASDSNRAMCGSVPYPTQCASSSS